jgi:hypothetical protein
MFVPFRSSHARCAATPRALSGLGVLLGRNVCSVPLLACTRCGEFPCAREGARLPQPGPAEPGAFSTRGGEARRGVTFVPFRVYRAAHSAPPLQVRASPPASVSCGCACIPDNRQLAGRGVGAWAGRSSAPGAPVVECLASSGAKAPVRSKAMVPPEARARCVAVHGWRSRACHHDRPVLLRRGIGDAAERTSRSDRAAQASSAPRARGAAAGALRSRVHPAPPCPACHRPACPRAPRSRAAGPCPDLRARLNRTGSHHC